MIKELFSKEHTNTNFLQELLKKDFDQKWLNEALKSELIDINHKDESGDSFLIKCIKTGRYTSAEWLIKKGANVTLKNNLNKTAINIAIEKNTLAIVKGLLDLKKIDVNQRDIDGRSLLQNVVVWGNNKMAKLLIQYGADINNIDNHERNVLYDALSFGDHSFIKYLLSLKEIELNYIDENGDTLMQHPEVLKNDAIAKELLIAGIDSTIKTKNGQSYLMNIILRGEEAREVIDTALEYGANINNKTINQNTIMMEIISISSKLPPEEELKKQSLLKTSKKMLEYNGDINAIDKNHETGLFNAIRLRDFELCSFLLSAGIDPNIQNNDGYTVLQEIIFDGIKSIDLILLLIKYKADPTIKNKHGKCIYELLNDLALHKHGTKIITDETIIEKITQNAQYINVIKELLEKNTKKLDYLDSTGNPLFFNPLLYDHFQLFKLYIKYNVDINTKNSANHNLFFEYILKVFEKDDDSPNALENFQNNLSGLINHKIDKNYKDALGWTVLHKIIGTKCNEKLFDILIRVVLFDYSITDKLGRSVVHNAVWGNKTNIIKKIKSISHDTINISDNYGILPITYASLLGNKEMVLFFLEMGSNISDDSKIAPQAIKKFKPMIKNLEKLLINEKDKSNASKLQSLIDQIKRDFTLKE